MATLQPLWVFDINGPKTDAAPIFVALEGFVDKDGNARAQPAGGIINKGGGLYTFQPTDDDELVGTCALIDCGVGCIPRYQWAAISRMDNQFMLVVPSDENGNLSAGAFTMGAYLDLTNGSARTPPPVLQVGAFEMYTATPSAADLAVGVSMQLLAPSAAVFPPSVSDAFRGGTVPVGAAATGALDDLCDVVDMLASGTYTVTRRAPPAFVRGRRAPPLQAVFTTLASVQPAGGQAVQRLPEGKRNRETMIMFCCVQLKTAETGQEPDLVAIDGGSFEVESVERWAALGNYYRAVVTRRPGT